VKFNIRLMAYLCMYVFGTTALLAQGANPVIIALFGLISVVTVMLLRFARPTIEPLPEDESSELPPLTPRGQAMKKELDMAHRVQQALLSGAPPTHPQLKIARRCDSANSVGGDFYCFSSQFFSELQEKPRRAGVTTYVGAHEECVGVAIGDVAGHGVSSALVMALSSGLIAEISHAERRPSIVLAKANNHIFKHIENSQVSYVTCVFATFFPAQRKMVFSVAGHPPVFIVHANGAVTRPAVGGIFLGMFPGESYAEKAVELQIGDRVVFYTDGLTETRNVAGEEFGIERLEATLKRVVDRDIDAALAAVFDAVATFSEQGPSKDDRTLVLVEVC
jgi:phosphoserine phosphatase RsbU/P